MTRITWLSRHAPLPAQRRALAEIFGPVEIDVDTKPFGRAEDLVRRPSVADADEVVVVAPLSVIRRLCEEGLRPLWAEMEEVADEGPLHLDHEVRAAGRRYRFVRFRRIIGVEVKYEELT